MIGRSLRNWVLLALVLISLVPLVITAFQGYHCGRMAATDLMRLHLVSIVEARHAMIADRLTRRIEGLERLAQLPGIIEGIQEYRDGENATAVAALEALLASAQALGEAYDDLTLFDATWHPIMTSGAGPHSPEDFTVGTFRDEMARANGVYLDVVHRHDGGKAGSHMGSAIRDAAGNMIGYLVANLNLTDDMNARLQDRSGLLKTGKAYIVDEELRVITEPFHDSAIHVLRAQGNPAITTLRESHGQTVGRYTDFLGHDVLGAAIPLGLHGWTLVAEIDAVEAMEWPDRLLFRASLMVIAVLCIVILISMWLSNFLTDPLAALAQGAHRVSEGFMDDRLGPMKTQEAEEVRRAFNRMLDDLRDKENQLVRTATLATVGELTSSVVHEMRNPLSSIKMNLQALRHCVAGDESNEELAAISERQVRRLESMLNELLQYGRPLEMMPERVSLRALVDTAVDSVAGFVRKHRVAVHLDDALAACELYVDPEQMARALENLVQNAAEAAPEGSEIEIDIRPSGDGGGIAIAVRDRGSGIRPEHAARLFKPFFTTRSDGVGLGLANVKKVVELLGGRIEAGNRDGGGAEFRIDLPGRLRA